MNYLDKQYAQYYKRSFKIAWPCIVEMFLFSIVSIIDAIMVGNLGAVATAAVGVNQPVTWLINSLCIGISVGATVLVAMHCGEDEIDKARNVARQAVFGGIVFGFFMLIIVFNLSNYIPLWIGVNPEVAPGAIFYLKTVSLAICLQFTGFICSGILRGSGNTKIPMFNAMVMNIVNVVGNFLLIYPTRKVSIFSMSVTIPGAGLGVKGAAIATCFALCLSGAMLITILFNKNLDVHISLDRTFRFQKRTLINILKIGIPTAGERLSINLGMVFFQSLIANLGTVSLSAHYLANIIESISYMPAEGFSMAATTLVGQSLGANNKNDAVIYSKITILCASFCGVLCGIVFMFFPAVLFSFFSSDPAVIEKGSGALQMMAVVEPFLCVSIVTTGVLRGSGDTKIPFYTSIAGMWGVRLLAAWFLAYHLGLGLRGAWIGMALDIMVRYALMGIRYKRKKWLNIAVSK